MAITLLIVDDAAFMRNAIRGVFAQEAFAIVAEAENGRDAIARYQEHLPDLVWMDLTMPIIDGIDATRRIIERYPDAKIVVVSALGQEHLVQAALDAGAVDFIVKPFDPDDVRRLFGKI